MYDIRIKEKSHETIKKLDKELVGVHNLKNNLVTTKETHWS